MKLMILDGNSIVNRAFYGIRMLNAPDGTPTNAVYGFLTIFQRILELEQPQAVCVAFDVHAPTFRHEQYALYKAQRKPMPEELVVQMPLLKQTLDHMGIRRLELAGWEADDLLGTVAKRCEAAGWACEIVTGDKDSLQLITDTTHVCHVKTRMGQTETIEYTPEVFRAEYGFDPIHMIDLKALMGDSSDNIPGVAGIGPKGAGELIQKYHDLDHIYSNIDTLDIKEGMRQKLIRDKDSAYLSRYLGTIRRDAPVDTELADYIPTEGDREGAARLLVKLEMFSLIEKLGLNVPTAAPETNVQEPAHEVVQGAPDTLFDQLRAAGRADCLVWYEDGQVYRVYIGREARVYELEGMDFLRKLCACSEIRINTHDVKPLYAALGGEEIPGGAFDTMLAAYLLNPSASSYDVTRLAQEYNLPLELPEQEALKRGDVEGKRRQTEALFRAQAAVFPALVDKLAEQIARNNQTELLETIELPLARVLAHMEAIGFLVDAEGIAQYGETLQAEIDRIQGEIYQSVGYEFNINSPRQLGDALFEKLGLPHGKKTKTGYSTKAEILENLRYEHPAVEMILNYRSLTKLKSTYCDGLTKVIAVDGRIHSNFNQTETRTGRISSTEPNLQNIPVRTDLGREMRRFFVAKEGCVLVDADYSQIELRVLAHVANDQNMIDAFLHDDDIHRITAAQVFHMPEQMVTPMMRSRAKAVNFGIVYGIGAFSLAKNIGVTRKEAEQYIHDYLAHYSGVDDYMKRVVEQAKEQGYVETMFGRRRYLPELASSNFNMRAFGERVARNMPIQGTAADIIKIAMIRVEDRLRKEGMKSRLILQVHDELIVEAPEDEAEKAAAVLTEEMRSAAQLSVPLIADAGIGKSWFDAKAG